MSDDQQSRGARHRASFTRHMIRSGFLEVAAESFLDWLRQERKGLVEQNDEIFERFENPPTDTGIHDAAKRLWASKEYFASAGYLKQHERADWQQVDPRIQEFAGRFMLTMRKQGIPLYVHGAFRTEAEQKALNKKGVSKTLYPRAAHCQGAAVDIVHTRYHWQMTSSEWQYLGAMGKQVATRLGLNLTWGGDWKNPYDPAHWELKGWDNNVRALVAEPVPIRKTPKQLVA